MTQTLTSPIQTSDRAFGSAAPGAQSLDVTVLGDNNWLASFVGRMGELRLLEDGWDGFGSPKPDPFLLDMARTLLSSLWRFCTFLPEPAVVPVPGGGIQLEWYFQGRELELELLADDGGRTRLEYLRVVNGTPADEGSTDEPGLVDLVLWLIEG